MVSKRRSARAKAIFHEEGVEQDAERLIDLAHELDLSGSLASLAIPAAISGEGWTDLRASLLSLREARRGEILARKSRIDKLNEISPNSPRIVDHDYDIRKAASDLEKVREALMLVDSLANPNNSARFESARKDMLDKLPEELADRANESGAYNGNAVGALQAERLKLARHVRPVHSRFSPNLEPEIENYNTIATIHRVDSTISAIRNTERALELSRERKECKIKTRLNRNIKVERKGFSPSEKVELTGKVAEYIAAGTNSDLNAINALIASTKEDLREDVARLSRSRNDLILEKERVTAYVNGKSEGFIESLGKAIQTQQTEHLRNYFRNVAFGIRSALNSNTVSDVISNLDDLITNSNDNARTLLAKARELRQLAAAKKLEIARSMKEAVADFIRSAASVDELYYAVPAAAGLSASSAGGWTAKSPKFGEATGMGRQEVVLSRPTRVELQRQPYAPTVREVDEAIVEIEGQFEMDGPLAFLVQKFDEIKNGNDHQRNWLVSQQGDRLRSEIVDRIEIMKQQQIPVPRPTQIPAFRPADPNQMFFNVQKAYLSLAEHINKQKKKLGRKQPSPIKDITEKFEVFKEAYDDKNYAIIKKDHESLFDEISWKSREIALNNIEAKINDLVGDKFGGLAYKILEPGLQKVLKPVLGYEIADIIENRNADAADEIIDNAPEVIRVLENFYKNNKKACNEFKRFEDRELVVLNKKTMKEHFSNAKEYLIGAKEWIYGKFHRGKKHTSPSEAEIKGKLPPELKGKMPQGKMPEGKIHAGGLPAHAYGVIKGQSLNPIFEGIPEEKLKRYQYLVSGHALLLKDLEQGDMQGFYSSLRRYNSVLNGELWKFRGRNIGLLIPPAVAITYLASILAPIFFPPLPEDKKAGWDQGFNYDNYDVSQGNLTAICDLDDAIHGEGATVKVVSGPMYIGSDNKLYVNESAELGTNAATLVVENAYGSATQLFTFRMFNDKATFDERSTPIFEIVGRSATDDGWKESRLLVSHADDTNGGIALFNITLERDGRIWGQNISWNGSFIDFLNQTLMWSSDLPEGEANYKEVMIDAYGSETVYFNGKVNVPGHEPRYQSMEFQSNSSLDNKLPIKYKIIIDKEDGAPSGSLMSVLEGEDGELFGTHSVDLSKAVKVGDRTYELVDEFKQPANLTSGNKKVSLQDGKGNVKLSSETYVGGIVPVLKDIAPVVHEWDFEGQGAYQVEIPLVAKNDPKDTTFYDIIRSGPEGAKKFEAFNGSSLVDNITKPGTYKYSITPYDAKDGAGEIKTANVLVTQANRPFEWTGSLGKINATVGQTERVFLPSGIDKDNDTIGAKDYSVEVEGVGKVPVSVLDGRHYFDFTPDVVGDYSFSAKVFDGKVWSDSLHFGMEVHEKPQIKSLEAYTDQNNNCYINLHAIGGAGFQSLDVGIYTLEGVLKSTVDVMQPGGEGAENLTANVTESVSSLDAGVYVVKAKAVDINGAEVGLENKIIKIDRGPLIENSPESISDSVLAGNPGMNGQKQDLIDHSGDWNYVMGKLAEIVSQQSPRVNANFSLAVYEWIETIGLYKQWLSESGKTSDLDNIWNRLDITPVYMFDRTTGSLDARMRLLIRTDLDRDNTFSDVNIFDMYTGSHTKDYYQSKGKVLGIDSNLPDIIPTEKKVEALKYSLFGKDFRKWAFEGRSIPSQVQIEPSAYSKLISLIETDTPLTLDERTEISEQAGSLIKTAQKLNSNEILTYKSENKYLYDVI